jgi:hypothetical protein
MTAGQEGVHAFVWGGAWADRPGELEGAYGRGGGAQGVATVTVITDQGNGGAPPHRAKVGVVRRTWARELVAE